MLCAAICEKGFFCITIKWVLTCSASESVDGESNNESGEYTDNGSDRDGRGWLAKGDPSYEHSSFHTFACDLAVYALECHRVASPSLRTVMNGSMNRTHFPVLALWSTPIWINSQIFALQTVQAWMNYLGLRMHVVFSTSI